MKPKQSKMLYWAVVNGKQTKMWPMEFSFRYGDAKDTMHRWNGYHPKTKPFRVERFLFVWRGTHYDVYQHEYKRIEK